MEAQDWECPKDGDSLVSACLGRTKVTEAGAG